MNKNAPEIRCLRQDIERKLNRHLRTPYDFEFLANEVRTLLHEHISPTTLKRLWGYIAGAETTRLSTLSLLAQFLGYTDWDAYLASLAARTDVESETFAGEGVRSAELQAGQLVEVTWLPDRRCIFRYEGGNTYTVIEARNAKLHAGDRFETACFLIGRPLYADRLIRGSEQPTSYADRLIRGSEQPTSYVAGSRNGLHSVTLLTL